MGWKQWIAGLAVSVVVGVVAARQGRQYEDDKVLANAGGTITSQAEFERALERNIAGRAKQFKDLIVHPVRLNRNDEPSRMVHVIVGKYTSGRPERQVDRVVLQWRPHYYVAEIPYKPTGSIGNAMGPNYTVVHYLEVLKSKGVSYKYLWWKEPVWWNALWIGGSIVILGVLPLGVLSLVVWLRGRKRPAAPAAVAPVLPPDRQNH